MDLEATQAINLDFDDFDDDEEEEETARTTPVAHLKVLTQKDLKETLYPIYKGSNSIGRSDAIDVNIPCKSLSKDHACIEVKGETHFIYDKGSRNKTKRQKMFLKPNIRYELKNNDALVFADLKCVYLRPDATPKRLSDTEDEAVGVKLDEPVMSVKKGLLATETYVYEEDEDDTNSDSYGRSSDIIEPTQPFRSDGSGPVVKSPKKVCFADDSIIDDENLKLSVAETPAAKCKKTASVFPTSAEYVSESDCEEDGDTTKESVSPVFIATPQSAEKRKHIQEMETQCYDVDMDTDAKRPVSYDSDATTDDEGTQGFDVQDAKPKEIAKKEEEEEEEEEEEYSMLTGATHAFNSQAAHAFANASTLENDFEFEDSEEGRKPGFQDLETQAFDEPVNDDDATPVFGDATQVMGDNEATQVMGDNEATQVIGDNEATQVIGDNEATQVIGDNEATQVIGDNEATQVMGDNEATQVMADNEATQVMGDNEATQVMGGNEATQVMEDNEATQVMADNEATQVMGDNEATQVMGDNEATQVMGDNEATQVMGDNEATQVMEDNEATQVMGDNEATQVMGDNEATQVMEDNEATQVMGDDEATQVMGDNEATQVMGDNEATQVMGDNEATQVMEDNEATQVMGDDEATQVMGDNEATQVMGDNEATQVMGDNEATQVMGDNEATQVMGDNEATQVMEDNEATQVIGDNEPTQVMDGNVNKAAHDMSDSDDSVDMLVVNKSALFAIPSSANTPSARSSDRNVEATQIMGDNDNDSLEINQSALFAIPSSTSTPSAGSSDRNFEATQVMSDVDATQVMHDNDDNEDSLEVDKSALFAIPSSASTPSAGSSARNFEETQVFGDNESEEMPVVKTNVKPVVPRKKPVKRTTRRSKVRAEEATQVFGDDSVDTIEVDIVPVKPKSREVAATLADESLHLKMEVTDASINSNDSTKEAGALSSVDLCAATQVFRGEDDDSDDSVELKLNNSVPKDSPEKFGRTSAVFGRVYSRTSGSKAKALTPSATSEKRVLKTSEAEASAKPSVSRASRRKSSAVASSSDAAPSKAKKSRRSVAAKAEAKPEDTEESAESEEKGSRNAQKLSNDEVGVRKGRRSLPLPPPLPPAKKPQRNTRRSHAVVEAVLPEEPVPVPARGRRGRNAKKTEEEEEKEDVTSGRPKRGRKSEGASSVASSVSTRSVSSSTDRSRSNQSRKRVTPSPKKAGNPPEESLKRKSEDASEVKAVVQPKRGRGGRKSKVAETEGDTPPAPSEMEEDVPPLKTGRGRRTKAAESPASSSPPVKDTKEEAAPVRRGRGRTKAVDEPPATPSVSKEDEEAAPVKNERGKKGKKSRESMPASEEVVKKGRGKRTKPIKESTAADDSVPSTQSTPVKQGRGRRTAEPTETAAEDSVASKQSTPVKKGRGRRTAEPTESVTLSPSSTPSSLRHRSPVNKPKIMFTGVLDDKAEKAVIKLGGEVVDSIFKCTHLICDQVRRTVKFLCGVSRGLVIVKPDWLHQSQLRGTFQDPVTYFVHDAPAEQKFKFRLTESIVKANESGMLAGHKCFITANVKPEPKQMADIIKCSGGQLLKSMPKSYSAQTVVISCVEDQAICKGALLAQIPVVSAEFLLTGVLRQQVDFELHKLFKDASRRPSNRR